MKVAIRESWESPVRLYFRPRDAIGERLDVIQSGSIGWHRHVQEVGSIGISFSLIRRHMRFKLSML